MFVEACAVLITLANLRATRRQHGLEGGHPPSGNCRGNKSDSAGSSQLRLAARPGPRLAFIRQYVELRAKRILDIGCGLGMYVSQFRQFSDDVYGVDIDPDKIARAGEWLPNLRVAPAEELPFADDSFDVILLNEVIEHVDDDRRAISEAHRVVAPGGHIVVYAPNRLYPFETHGFFFGGKYHGPCNLPILANWVPDFVRNYFAPHVRIYTQGDVTRLFGAVAHLSWLR
ncbi:MAG: class I SAM-dependent methyltransferase [Chloroflexi bacterium]|nr:MAG: class I SAM-dependent methyltransferase [Chloroflexota bacterium]